MSIKIKTSWTDNNAIIEGVRIYKSAMSFDVNSKPTVYAEILDGSEFYEDLDAIEGQTYFYMLSCFLGEQEAFTECFEINAETSKEGVWALAVACWGTATLPQFNIEETTAPTWSENFRKTISIIAYTRNYNSTGNITTLGIPTKVIDASKILGRRFEIVVSAGAYNGNYGRMFIEFLDNSDAVLAALKVDKGVSVYGAFGSTLQIGDTLDTVANVSKIGMVPTANGFIDVLPTGIVYTPRNLESTERFNTHTFSKDMSDLSKIRISSLEAHQNHSSSDPGSPTGSSAYVYFKLLL